MRRAPARAAEVLAALGTALGPLRSSHSRIWVHTPPCRTDVALIANRVHPSASSVIGVIACRVISIVFEYLHNGAT